MSRIGKLPISLPQEVSLSIQDKNKVIVKGPQGSLSLEMKAGIDINNENQTITLTRKSESKEHRSLHGLYRSLIYNMVEGVSKGFTVNQELVGVGYRAKCTNNILDLTLGYSHHIVMVIPEEVKVSASQKKGKNPVITLESIDKQLIGQVAAKIRSLRPPEPYKGKGIRFLGEEIVLKPGKAAAK